MKRILIVKPKTLSATNKKELQDNDVIVIEHPLPSEVVVVNPIAEIESNDLLLAALHGLINETTHSGKSNFVNSLYKRLSDKQRN